MSDWRSIETRPTEEGAEYLVRERAETWLVKVNYSGSLQPKDNGCGCCSSAIYDATHWMPVPPPPGVKCPHAHTKETPQEQRDGYILGTKSSATICEDCGALVGITLIYGDRRPTYFDGPALSDPPK